MRNLKKTLLSHLLIIALIMSSFGTVVFAADKKDEIDLQLLVTSDMHGKFYPYDYALNEESPSGSLAQASTLINKLKTDNTILIDVGDTIQDNSSDLFLKDKVHPMIAGMNEVGYDVWVTGNHEYNYGMDILKNVMKQFKSKVLVGNVYNSDGSAIADKYTIIEKGGVKIGIIGMVTPNITRWDSANLKGYKVTDPVEETKKVINEIKDKVDIIVAAQHMGEENEYGVKNSGVNDLAQSCPEIDVILAAHEHKAVPGTYVNDVLIVENKSGAATVTQVNLTLKKGTDGKYEIANRTSKNIETKDYESDKKILTALESYHKRAVEDASTVIGKLKGGDLAPANEITGIPQAQIQETAMINLINEVQTYYTGADISAAALFNVDSNLKEGDIKKSDTSLIYKYANTLYKLEMTGAQLKKYMEWSANYYNTYKPGDLTISFNEAVRAYNYDMFTGVNYDINIAKEAGNRIENLTTYAGTPIKDTDKFVVAVNNYRANSQLLVYGEIFKEGEQLPKLLEIDVKGDLGGVRELIRDFIQKVENGTIEPQLNDNWKIVGNNWDKAQHEKVVELVKKGSLKVPASADGRTPNVRSITENDIKNLK